jgi:hypothetical protein
MGERRETVRRLGGPLFSALAWVAAACGSDATNPNSEFDPFAAETFDESVESLEQARRALAESTSGGSPGAGGSAGTGAVPGSGGSDPSGAGGTFPAGAGGGPVSVGGSGPIGDGGPFGAGGFPGGAAGVGGFPSDGGLGFGGVGGAFGVGGSIIPPDGGPFGRGGVGGTGGLGGTGGTAGMAGSAGVAGTGGGPTGIPSAFWTFDDCSPVTRALLDSSGNGIHAVRKVSTECAEGIQGLGVDFNEEKDRVEALNAPQFTLDRRLAVAAWVNPRSIDANRPVVLKRLNDQTAFSLRIQNEQAQFSITLDSGRTVTTRMPVPANSWSHIAGLFDGRFVFLFLNGEQVGQIFAEGSIRDVDSPIRIGATTQTQHFDGVIDNVFISTNPVTAADIAGLACIRNFSTLTVSPETSGPVPPGTTVPYDVAVSNNDVGACGPKAYSLNSFFTPGFTTTTIPFFLEVPRGQTGHFEFGVTSSEELEPGVFQIPFFVNSFSGFFEQLFGQATYEVSEPTGCNVRTGRELFVRNPSVVDDPVRTNPDGPPSDPRTGAWTFGKLVENAAPSPEQAPDMIEQVVRTWLTDQTVNSFTLQARPSISFILDNWPRTPDGKLDLKRAPMRLLGIVNRFDLRNLDAGHAGEGRFVFGVTFQGSPLEFTMILEYQLLASTEAQVMEWANAWHALGSLPFPSEEYNAALQAITDRFTARNAAPGRTNGSALLTLRSNEIALSSVWQLREFRLAPDGFLRPSTIALTPDAQFNFSPRLANFINQNESSILAERHVVPEIFEGAPFQGGAVLNNPDFWAAQGVLNNEARHKFSLNTCNGCHGIETQTPFLQVNPRFPGQESTLSGFMTGIDAFDPISGQPRRLNDLGRRNADLKALVCPPDAPSAGPRLQSAQSSTGGTSVRRGIGRVH